MAFDYAGKIRALLATADSYRESGNDEAAATFEAKARRFMIDYQIAEEDALAVDPATVVPMWVKIEFVVRDYAMSDYYSRILVHIADHTGTRVNVSTSWIAQYRKFDVTLVGYEGDVRYAEFLWTSAYLMFSTRIDPTWDVARPEAENIFFMRNAGLERRVIADAAWGRGAGREAKNRSKVQRVYLAEARRRGEDARATGLGFSTEQYRTAYAQSFVATLEQRLRAARDAADSLGGVVTLAGRMERVNEALYELFPHRRPTPPSDVTVRPTKSYLPENYVSHEDCPKCKAALSGYCRTHNYLKPMTPAQEAAYDRRNRVTDSMRAGSASGRHAAEGVGLRGTASPRATRLDQSGKAIEG